MSERRWPASRSATIEPVREESTMTTKHSPLPWHVKTHPHGPEIYDRNNNLVAQFGTIRQDTINANAIVKQMNDLCGKRDPDRDPT